MKTQLKEVCLEITNSCPMYCMHCSVFGETRNFYDMYDSIMPLHKIKSMIDQICDLGGEIIELSGGEPLVHPNILEIIKYSKEKGLEVRLYTSGLFVHPDKRITEITTSIANDLSASGLDKIIFNIQGSNPATHEQITRSSGSFQKAVQGIRNLKALNMVVGVHFVPMKLNHKDLPSVLELCSGLKVDEVSLLRFVPQGRGQIYQSELELSKEEFATLMEIIEGSIVYYGDKLKIRLGCPINFLPLLDKTFKSPECEAAKSTCLITYTGNVVPCAGFKQNINYIVGNINKNSLEKIWRDSTIMDQLRNFHYSMVEECRNCIESTWCKARCHAQRVIAFGDIFHGPDPLCPKEHLNNKKMTEDSNSDHETEFANMS